MKLYAKIILLGLLILLFKGPLESISSKTLVQPIFSKMTSGAIMDIATFGLIGFGIYFMKGKWKEVKISNLFLISALSIFIFYLLFYRIGVWGSPWTLYSVFVFPWLRYADIFVILPVIAVVILKMKYVVILKTTEQKKPLDNHNGFFEDRPLSKEEDDDLGLRPYADAVAEKIKNTTPQTAFAIGINGLWGSGKTSFLDCVCDNLDDENFLQIKFNPWNSNSPNAIVNDFFMSFQESIREENPDISKKLLNYGNRLIELSSNSRFKFIVDTFRSISGGESVDSIHAEISKSLEKLDKRIVITIDDVDRLNSHEVVEVLRLVRNTANFPKVFFLVAYDREYLVNSLKSLNPHGKERYVEKIFQLELNLPLYNRRILREKLVERIRYVTPVNFHKEMEETLLGSDVSQPLYFEEQLTSMRDVTRLANSVALNFMKLQNEVDFVDFIRIEIVRMRYPMLYSLIRDFREDYFVAIDSKFSRYEKVYVLRANLKKDEQGFQKEAPKAGESSFLYDDFKKFNGDYAWLSTAIEFIHEIFGSEDLINVEGVVSLKSIRNPAVFPLYFTYKLLPGYFSKGNFQKARKSGMSAIEEFIRDNIDDGLEFPLANELRSINSFESKDDFEIIIGSIFYLANRESIQKNKTYRETVYFPVDNLFDKLMNRNDILAKLFYEGENQPLKKFLKGVLKKAKYPFSLEVDLLKYANERHENEFVLNQQELNDLGYYYLSRAIHDSDGWDIRALEIYFSLKIKRNGKIVLPTDVKNLFKSYLNEKGLEGFILLGIHPEPGIRNSFTLSKEYLEIWSDFNSYEAFIKKSNSAKTEYVQEYLSFIDKWKSQATGYIDFEFKHIPVDEKVEIERAARIGDVEKILGLDRKYDKGTSQT